MGDTSSAQPILLQIEVKGVGRGEWGHNVKQSCKKKKKKNKTKKEKRAGSEVTTHGRLIRGTTGRATNTNDYCFTTSVTPATLIV